MDATLTLEESLMLKPSKTVGIAADHGGQDLKQHLVMELRAAGAEVVDFGDLQLTPADEHPDFVVTLARAVATGKVERGIAICGSGVGASVVANRVKGVRACLIHDPFSAHQGVEDEDLNLICLGGLVVGHALAWELVRTYLTAKFSGRARHRRRLDKIMALECQCFPGIIETSISTEQAPNQNGIETEGNSTNKTRPLRIYFIRHGATEWSLTGRYTGNKDIPLTTHGRAAARAVGSHLRGTTFAHALTSPHKRARQTCALVGLEPPSAIEPDLAEWDHGDDEGLTPAEIFESRPKWNLFRDGSPNGESPSQISDRADRLIAHLRTLDGNVALFSHSHIGRVLAARWIGLPAAQAQHWLLDTASISVLCYDHDRIDQPAIALWNSKP